MGHSSCGCHRRRGPSRPDPYPHFIGLKRWSGRVRSLRRGWRGEHVKAWGGRRWFPAPLADRLPPPAKAACGMSMRIQIQLRIIADDDSVISEDDILQLDKSDDRLEAIGLSLGSMSKRGS